MEVRVPVHVDAQAVIVAATVATRVTFRRPPTYRSTVGRGANTTNRADRVLLGPQPGSDRFRTFNRRTERRINAVCWHGHREWMLQVFRLVPEATIATTLVTYRGVRDFQTRHESTHGWATRDRSCTCDED